MYSVKPHLFRPRFYDFWRQATGCANLAVTLPAFIVISILFALPWKSTAPWEEWLAGAKTGHFVGAGCFFVFIVTTALIKKYLMDLAEAKATTDSVNSILNQSIAKAESARMNAVYGSQWVNQAYDCFATPEYIPFWESVEHAETYFRMCCETLAEIHAYRESFAKALSGREHTFPDIDTEMGVLFDPRLDMSRLTEIVRKANGDVTFSTIHAQRATTKAVREGFSGLVAAIRQMETNVTAAIEKLRTSVIAEIKNSTGVQVRILQGVQLIATNTQHRGKP